LEPALVSEQLLRSLFSNLEKIRTEQSPYSKVPAKGRNRRGEGLTAAEMRRCHWVKPVMVCQVKFTEWTRDDRLRQPVFLDREDKKRSGSGEGKLKSLSSRNIAA
jgi:bifunctional non-homologous end joining protein LigD